VVRTICADTTSGRRQIRTGRDRYQRHRIARQTEMFQDHGVDHQNDDRQLQEHTENRVKSIVRDRIDGSKKYLYVLWCYRYAEL